MKANVILLPLLFLVMMCVLSAAAQEHSEAEKDAKKYVPKKFNYELENRPDPFYPFISKEQAQTEEPDVIVGPPPGPLVDLQRFEPGQLKLVAVMNTPQGKIAMVEDVTGKGYILQKGMKIGAYGQIIDIKEEDSQVIIKETREFLRSKKTVENEIIMQLKKDGKR
jgi:type IV pilus assembly protein PilP